MTPGAREGSLPHDGAPDRMTGALFALGSVVLFASFTLASRLGFSAALKIPDIAALRFGIGGLLMTPVLARYGLQGVRWRDAGALALFGGVGFALLAYTGFSLAPAAHGAILLHGTLPLTTFLLGSRGRSGRAAYRPAGLVLIAAGVLMMAYDSAGGTSLRQLAGDGFLLAASFAWSAYGLWTRRLGLAPAQGAAIVAVFSMCAFLPVYALIPGKALLAVGASELLLQGLVQGVLIGAVSIFVYTRAVTALGPETTALFTAAVPCVTTLAAVPLLHERPDIPTLAGLVTVTSGMLAARPRRPA